MVETLFKQNDGVIVLAPVIEKYVFSKPLQGIEAREIFSEVKGRVAKDFKNAPAFDAYFKFNKQTGQLNGSNTFYGILIDHALSKEDLWIPTIVEAKRLDALGKLQNGIYREYGIAIYDNQEPNSEMAEILVEEANKRGWQLPILAPFKALGIRKSKNNEVIDAEYEVKDDEENRD